MSRCCGRHPWVRDHERATAGAFPAWSPPVSWCCECRAAWAVWCWLGELPASTGVTSSTLLRYPHGNLRRAFCATPRGRGSSKPSPYCLLSGDTYPTRSRRGHAHCPCWSPPELCRYASSFSRSEDRRSRNGALIAATRALSPHYRAGYCPGWVSATISSRAFPQRARQWCAENWTDVATRPSTPTGNSHIKATQRPAKRPTAPITSTTSGTSVECEPWSSLLTALASPAASPDGRSAPHS